MSQKVELWGQNLFFPCYKKYIAVIVFVFRYNIVSLLKNINCTLYVEKLKINHALKIRKVLKQEVKNNNQEKKSGMFPAHS